MSRETSRGELSVVELCDLFKVSRQAYYAARRAPPEATPPPRAERQGAWVTNKALLDAIKAVVAEHPAWGVRKVWAVLRRNGTAASRKRVWAIMRANSLTLAPNGERSGDQPRGHVTTPWSNRRWSTDLTTVWTRDDGLVAIAPVIDCGDRSVLAIAATKSQEAPDVVAPVSSALREQFGAPTAVPDGLELRTDNGPQYTSSTCDQLCKAWGLSHTFSPPGRPTGNAVSERVILTLKLELVWLRDWTSLAELQAALEAWRVTYNTARPHQALNWRTPAEQRSLNLAAPLAAEAA